MEDPDGFVFNIGEWIPLGDTLDILESLPISPHKLLAAYRPLICELSLGHDIAQATLPLSRLGHSRLRRFSMKSFRLQSLSASRIFLYNHACRSPKSDRAIDRSGVSGR